MAVVLDATPGGVAANSYVTVAEAAAYVETFVLEESNRDAWNDLDVDDKSRLLIQATRQIDWYFTWDGRRTNDDQSLEWPRYWIYRDRYLLDQNEVPAEVKNATVEMALWLRTQLDSTPADGTYQFNEIAVGSLRINFNEKFPGQSKIYMPDKVVSLLQEFGEAKNPDVPMASQARSVRLERA